MESTLTLSDAKARFSEIVEKATNGEEFIVTRMGKPVVRITRFTAHGRPRKLDDFAGRIRMSEDFDDWPPTCRRRWEWPSPGDTQGVERLRVRRFHYARIQIDGSRMVSGNEQARRCSENDVGAWQAERRRSRIRPQ